MKRPLSAFFLMACLVPAYGQKPTPAAPPADAKAKEEQALKLVDTIAGTIPSLRSSENRIFVTCAIAEILWTRDEPRARTLFESLAKEVISKFAALDPSDQHSTQILGTMQQQRREIIDRMAPRDPEMALAFLKATRSPADFDSKNNHLSEESIELHLASMVAMKKPEIALKMGRTALKRGVSHSLVSLLQTIGAKSPEVAHTFHAELIERLKMEDLANNLEAINIASILLVSFQPPQAKVETYRELVEFVITSVMAVSPTSRENSYTQSFLNQLRMIMPQIEKYAPERVAALRLWSDSVRGSLEPNARMYQEINELTERGTVEEMLALADRYPIEQRTPIYQQAAWKAQGNGDFARARQIINELVKDPVQRRQMLDQIESQQVWQSVNEYKIAEARSVIRKLKTAEQRASMLVNLSMSALGKGSRELALELLGEATALVNAMPQNSNRLNTQLQIINAYANLDSERSVEMMQSLVVHLNQLVAAAAVLDGFENSYLREGEWTRHNYSSLGGVVTSVEQNIGTLAQKDLEAAKSLSAQLERPEIRIMAQLEIAKSVLETGNNERRVFSRRIITHLH